MLLNTSKLITAGMKTFTAASGILGMGISDSSGDARLKLGAYPCLVYSKCWSSSSLHYYMWADRYLFRWPMLAVHVFFFESPFTVTATNRTGHRNGQIMSPDPWIGRGDRHWSSEFV